MFVDITGRFKRIRCLQKYFIMLAVMMVFGCQGGGGEGGGGALPNPVNPSAESFKFVLITDTHVRLPGNPDDGFYDNDGNLRKFDDALDRIRDDHADAEFVLSAGDNVGCLFSSDPDDYGIGSDNPAERFKEMMDSIGKSYYVALGNHDYQEGFNTSRGEGITAGHPSSIEAVWKKVLGINPYYSFVHKGVRFIVLNSVRGPEYSTACPSSTDERACKGSFDEVQMDWLETELINPEYCLIFLHHPIITDFNSIKIWSAAGAAWQVRSDDRFYTVVRTYKDRIKGIFVGHGHVQENDTFAGTIPVHETAAIGDYNGSGSHIRAVWMDPFTGKMITK